MTTGDKIAQMRKENNLTQEQLADLLGVSRQSVSKWENGSADPSTANLIALARLYGVDPGELLRGVTGDK